MNYLIVALLFLIASQGSPDWAKGLLLTCSGTFAALSILCAAREAFQ